MREQAPPVVLIVDDDPTTTRVLEGLLRGAGFTTETAIDLGEADRLLNSRSFSLILLDVHLPDGNGLDFCERLAIRPATDGVPILFISANDDIHTKVRGFAAGAVDYITKPLAGAEVLARVQTHLRLRAAYRALADLQAERIQRLAASQQSLMPTPESLPEARFQAFVRQAERAGGDFYDVIPAGAGITDYVVADASGHDLGVSLWTASFKTLLREYGSVLYAPLDVCRLINSSLRRLLSDGAYFSALYARLNRVSKDLILVNAGHPGAILVSGELGRATVVEQEGDLIGVFPDAVFGQLRMRIKAGNRLFLYSDGLIEKAGSRVQGTALLLEACDKTMQFPLDEAVPRIVDRLGLQAGQQDDMVLLGIEV